MHMPNAEADTRRMDDVRFRNLITRKECANVSIAEAELEGSHGPSRSHRSDRIYYLISGHVKVAVDDEVYEVAPGDAILIPKGARHAISGNAKYLVINSPAFDLSQEEIL